MWHLRGLWVAVLLPQTDSEIGKAFGDHALMKGTCFAFIANDYFPALW